MVLTVSHCVSYILCAVNIYRQRVVWTEFSERGVPGKASSEGGSRGICSADWENVSKGVLDARRLMEKTAI
jgi:hypothetical protein